LTQQPANSNHFNWSPCSDGDLLEHEKRGEKDDWLGIDGNSVQTIMEITFSITLAITINNPNRIVPATLVLEGVESSATTAN